MQRQSLPSLLSLSFFDVCMDYIKYEINDYLLTHRSKNLSKNDNSSGDPNPTQPTGPTYTPTHPIPPHTLSTRPHLSVFPLVLYCSYYHGIVLRRQLIYLCKIEGEDRFGADSPYRGN